MRTVEDDKNSSLNGCKKYIPDARESFVSLDLKSKSEEAFQKKTAILVTYHSLNIVYQMCRDLPLSYSCKNHRYLSNSMLIIRYQVFCNLAFTYGGLNLCYL